MNGQIQSTCKQVWGSEFRPRTLLKSDAVVLVGFEHKTVNKRINTPSSTANWPGLWIAHPASKQGQIPQVSLCEDACTTAGAQKDNTHKHANYTHIKTHTIHCQVTKSIIFSYQSYIYYQLFILFLINIYIHLQGLITQDNKKKNNIIQNFS